MSSIGPVAEPPPTAALSAATTLPAGSSALPPCPWWATVDLDWPAAICASLGAAGAWAVSAETASVSEAPLPKSTSEQL